MGWSGAERDVGRAGVTVCFSRAVRGMLGGLGSLCVGLGLRETLGGLGSLCVGLGLSERCWADWDHCLLVWGCERDVGRTGVTVCWSGAVRVTLGGLGSLCVGLGL